MITVREKNFRIFPSYYFVFFSTSLLTGFLSKNILLFHPQKCLFSINMIIFATSRSCFVIVVNFHTDTCGCLYTFEIYVDTYCVWKILWVSEWMNVHKIILPLLHNFNYLFIVFLCKSLHISMFFSVHPSQLLLFPPATSCLHVIPITACTFTDLLFSSLLLCFSIIHYCVALDDDNDMLTVYGEKNCVAMRKKFFYNVNGIRDEMEMCRIRGWKKI